MGAPITGYFLRLVVDRTGVRQTLFFSDARVNDFSGSLNDAVKMTQELTIEGVLFAEIIYSQFANVSDSGFCYYTTSTGDPPVGFVDGNDSGRAIQGVTLEFGQTPTSIFYSPYIKYGGSLDSPR